MTKFINKPTGLYFILKREPIFCKKLKQEQAKNKKQA